MLTRSRKILTFINIYNFYTSLAGWQEYLLKKKYQKEKEKVQNLLCVFISRDIKICV